MLGCRSCWSTCTSRCKSSNAASCSSANMSVRIVLHATTVPRQNALWITPKPPEPIFSSRFTSRQSTLSACSSSAGGEAVISRDFAPVAPGPRTPPASEMTAAHSVWEWRRASSRGWPPQRSTAFGFAPAARRYLTTSSLPSLAAKCSAARPSNAVASMLILSLSSSDLTSARSPLDAATMRPIGSPGPCARIPTSVRSHSLTSSWRWRCASSRQVPPQRSRRCGLAPSEMSMRARPRWPSEQATCRAERRS
mmetsp:Transcript_33797/g.109216  ORF Transcript_33797/g.109216 Transcript_33797/m.109216 type:complete len:252 (+) Transcript_33797:191-946(+)